MIRHLTTKRIVAGTLLWMIATTAVIFVPDISPWIASPFVILALVVVIGGLLALNLDVPSESIAEYALYSIGLGLAFLVIGGLVINWALPYLGVSQPLARLPLTICFDLVAIVLALRVYFFDKGRAFLYSLPRTNGVSVFFGIIPWIFLVLSICGAEILNNGGTGAVTLFMISAIVVYVLAIIAYRDHVDGWAYISAIYSIGLSMLFMYSLRSPHILGWDINQEYQVFQMTLQNLRWKMSYYPGLDYNACMSLTILPTIFAVLTRIPSEYVYKATFQIFFAILPVTVYVVARRYMKEFLAFLTAFIFISQTWFFEQMPSLIRQELAFIFYAVMILVLFDKRLGKRTQYILFSIFAVALILSHYSTAYVLVAFLLIALILSYATRIFIPSFRKQPMAIKPMMLIIAVVFLYVWQVPLTHISGTATGVVTYISHAPIAAALPVGGSGTTAGGASGTSSTTTATSSSPAGPPKNASDLSSIFQNAFSTILFTGNVPTTQQNLIAAENNALYLFSGPHAAADLYPASDTAGYAPVNINEDIQIPSKLPAPLSSLIGFLALAAKIIFIDIFPLIAIVGIFIALRRRGNATTPYDFILLNVSAFLLVICVVFLPNLQEFYSVTRLYLQTFITLAILAMIGGMTATGRFGKYQIWILGVMIVLMYASFNGALDHLIGGQARITLDQPPSTFDPYYIHESEIAAAQWLAANRDPADPVQADNVAYLRLQSFTDIASGPTPIFPQTIERNSYVYLIQENVVQDYAFDIYNSNLLTYNYPLDFLNTEKDLIYNDGGSRIYR